MPVTTLYSSHTRTIFPTELYKMRVIWIWGLMDTRPNTELRVEL